MDRKFASRGSKSGRFESCWQRSVAVIDKGLIRVGYSQMASGSVRFGSVRFGSVRFGSVRFGSVRFVESSRVESSRRRIRGMNRV